MKADPENRPYRDHTMSSLIDMYKGMVAQLDGIDSYDMDDIQAWQRMAAISDCAIEYANEIMHRFDDHAKNILDDAVAKRKQRTTPPLYCTYGSCTKNPNHDGDHRCRCGKLCDAPADGCAWHLAGENRP